MSGHFVDARLWAGATGSDVISGPEPLALGPTEMVDSLGH